MAEALTDETVRRAVSDGRAGRRIELADAAEPGLRLRAGRRSVRWALLTRDADGHRIRVLLGAWPAMDLRSARMAARAVKRRQSGSANARVAMELEDLLDIYHQQHLQGLRSGKGAFRSLRSGLGELLDRELGSLSPRELDAALRGIATNSPAHANRIHSYARAMFSWAVRAGYMDLNPAALVQRPARERPRVHAPTLVELTMIMEAGQSLGYPFHQITWLLILTACRRDQIGSMRVEELHLPAGSDVGCWTIPPERSNTGRAMRVPLSPFARLVVQQALDWRLRPQSPYVFTTTGEAPVSGWSKAKTRLDTAAAGWVDWDLRPWRFQDLRRSFASTACEVLQVPPDVVRCCLNKAPGAWAGGELFEQRRDALERWSTLILTELKRTGRQFMV